MERHYNGKPNDDKPKVRRIPSPYVPGLSERINKSLKDHNLTLACKSSNNIGNLYTKTKYTVPKNEKSKVIYEVECECGKRYVGNTKQLVKKRFSKHKSDVKLKKTRETTGLTVHSVIRKHEFDYDHFTILDHIPDYHQRNIAEKMHIVKTDKTVNLTIDTTGLHPSYATFFKNHRPPPKTKKNQNPTTNRP